MFDIMGVWFGLVDTILVPVLFTLDNESLGYE